MRRDDAVQCLRTARGQLDAVVRMLEDHRYCTEVLYQLNTVERALDHAKRSILDEHFHVCVREGGAVSTPRLLEELFGALYGGRPPGSLAAARTPTGALLAQTTGTPHPERPRPPAGGRADEVRPARAVRRSSTGAMRC